MNDFSLFPNNGFNDDSVETFSAEISTQFNYDRLTGRVGAYYYESEDSLLFDVSAPFSDAIPNGIPGISLAPQDAQIIARVTDGTQTENYAFYAQFRYELSAAWTLAAGLRYDHEEFETTGLQQLLEIQPSSCVITVPGNLVGMPDAPGLSLLCTDVLPPDEPSIPQAESYSAWLPRASITYHYNEDVSVFLSAQRGYRAGGTYVQSTILEGVPVTLQDSYDPEYLTNFELGLRTYCPDQALTINGSIFYSTLDDQQISLPGPTGSSQDVFTANVGETEIYGLELSSSYAATEALNIYASLGLLHAEFKEFPFATQVPESKFFTLNGNEPELAPGITVSIGLSYKHASGAFADVNVSYIDGAETGVENLREEDLVDPDIPGSFVDLGVDPALAEGLDETADSRTNVNLRLGYKHEKFTLAFFGTNIFDDDTPLSQGFARVTAANGGLNLFSEPFFKLQAPRTLGLQVDFAL